MCRSGEQSLSGLRRRSPLADRHADRHADCDTDRDAYASAV